MGQSQKGSQSSSEGCQNQEEGTDSHIHVRYDEDEAEDYEYIQNVRTDLGLTWKGFHKHAAKALEEYGLIHTEDE